MYEKKKIFAIHGSASLNSANLSILKIISKLGAANFDLKICDDLEELPHFRTELTDKNVPDKIIELRYEITKADGIIICTPEYVFSLPSRLKNVIEWCVSTTVFSNKPTGLITASTSGIKAHEELKLIMETVQARLTDETTLLIQGVKGKMRKNGEFMDNETIDELKDFIQSFQKSI